jgi:hypothetical protein
MDDIVRREWTAVLKRDAVLEVKGVPQAVGRDLPALGEPGFDASIRCEARQSVEDVGDGSASRDVGGERRVQGARIVGVAGVDDLVSGWRTGRAACSEAKRNASRSTIGGRSSSIDSG